MATTQKQLEDALANCKATTEACATATKEATAATAAAKAAEAKAKETTAAALEATQSAQTLIGELQTKLAEPAPQAPQADAVDGGMPLEDALKLVKREVLEPADEEGGEPTVKEVEITRTEVASFKDYGDRVVVVTTDGIKVSKNY